MRVEAGRKAKVGAPKAGVRTGNAHSARLSERVVAGVAGWDDESGTERSMQQLFFPQSQCPQRLVVLVNSARLGSVLCASTTTALRSMARTVLTGCLRADENHAWTVMPTDKTSRSSSLLFDTGNDLPCAQTHLWRYSSSVFIGVHPWLKSFSLCSFWLWLPPLQFFSRTWLNPS